MATLIAICAVALLVVVGLIAIHKDDKKDKKD